MTDDTEQSAYTTILNGMQDVRRVWDPKDISATVEPFTPPGPGEFMLLAYVAAVASRKVAETVLSKLQSLRIQLQINVPERYSGDVKFTFHPREGARACKFVAPWYVDLYTEGTLLHPRVKSILTSLNDVARLDDAGFIFRGEQAMYPRVTSTLARRWRTASAEALKAISESNFTEANKFLQGPRSFDTQEARKRYERDVFAVIQHMGGATNLVDFTTDIWVALFFACTDATTPVATPNEAQNTNPTGRIWMLDQGEAHAELEIATLDHLTPSQTNSRWTRQSGVIVIPSSGIVPESCLNEVVLIPVEHKSQLNEFLRSIEIDVHTMYGDIEGYIRYGQQIVGGPAVGYIMAERLRNKDYDTAMVLAQKVLDQISDDSGKSIGYYFRGLSHALCGRLGQACDDLRRFVEMGRDVPEYAKRNVEIVQEAWERNRQRDYSFRQYSKRRSLEENLCVDVNEDLFVTTIGYARRVQR